MKISLSAWGRLSALTLALIVSLTGSPWESLRTTGAQPLGPSPYLVGDLDGNYRVDFKDLWIFGQQWLDPGCLILDCIADLDDVDGVNMSDFALLAGNWQEGPKVVINEIHYDPDVKTELV